MTRTLLLAACLGGLSGPAAAGETACWFENNVVVVAAEVMGVSGDFILDTATPHTQLGDSQAQTAGYAETALTGEVRVAGLVLAARPVAVANLDMRTGALPTPIAGVIGADVLRDYVLDVSFAPCRVALRTSGQAGPFPSRVTLPIAWTADRPVVDATVSDGTRTLTGAFTLATGGDTAVRLSDALAAAPGAAKPKELYPYGVLFPHLRALSFAGSFSENLAAGLVAAEDPGLAGELGTPLLSRWRLRFDFPRSRLLLAETKKGPAQAEAPDVGGACASAPRSSRPSCS
ncbi:MAG: hypothetical protein ACJ798_09395 [Phenylobacterium sp.]